MLTESCPQKCARCHGGLVVSQNVIKIINKNNKLRSIFGYAALRVPAGTALAQ
jgi:hypothetical protein